MKRSSKKNFQDFQDSQDFKEKGHTIKTIIIATLLKLLRFHDAA